MFSNAQAVSAAVRLLPRGRRAFQGFGALDTEEIAAVQTALNNAYSPSNTVLVVDGIWGPKSRARMIEFQRFIGVSANGRVDDYNALVALGLPASRLTGATVTGSTTGSPIPGATVTGSVIPFPSATLPPLPSYTPTPSPTPTPGTGLANTLGVSTGTLELLGLGLVAVIVLAALKR